MSTLGTIHTAFATGALLFGGAVLALPKATRLHVRLGWSYVASMLAMNGTSFFLQSFFGPFGPFHVLAVISLGTVAVGLLPVLFKRPRRSWLHWHYYGMLLSYVGLLAATTSEVTVRLLPGIRSWPEFWFRTIGSTSIVSVAGLILVICLRQRTFRRLKGRFALPKQADIAAPSLQLPPDLCSPRSSRNGAS